jgi:Rod binding domain-containing protein
MRPDLRLAMSAAKTPVQPAEVAALGREFEAAMLTPLVESMMPSGENAVWGERGAIWRGLFAQEVAAEIARAGGVGIADMAARAMARNEGDAA